MPLVTLCGLPGAGKTWLATRLRDHFVSLGKDVVLVNDESERMERALAYQDSRAEKMTRSAFKSRVQHHLNPHCIVILDTLNYIKGCRYELFCLAKENSTTHCVVYFNTSIEAAQSRNELRDGDKFPNELVDAIARRFEMPNEKNRWDSPLINISQDIADASVRDVLTEIEQVILHGKVTRAGVATQAKPVVETTFLQELDDITNGIVDEIIARQREFDLVDPFSVQQAAKKISFSLFLDSSYTKLP